MHHKIKTQRERSSVNGTNEGHVDQLKTEGDDKKQRAGKTKSM